MTDSNISDGGTFGSGVGLIHFNENFAKQLYLIENNTFTGVFDFFFDGADTDEMKAFEVKLKSENTVKGNSSSVEVIRDSIHDDEGEICSDSSDGYIYVCIYICIYRMDVRMVNSVDYANCS